MIAAVSLRLLYRSFERFAAVLDSNDAALRAGRHADQMAEAGRTYPLDDGGRGEGRLARRTDGEALSASGSIRQERACARRRPGQWRGLCARERGSGRAWARARAARTLRT